MKRIYPCLAGILLIAGLVPAAEAKTEEVSLTVYNQNFGFIRVERDLELSRGQIETAFKEVAATIDPTSVHFRSLTDPEGTIILEQNYEYDLVSSSKLFEKYLGKPVSLLTREGALYRGILGSFDSGQLVLLDAERREMEGEAEESVPVAMVRQDQLVDVRFPELPEGLMTIPTLKWLLQVAKGGTHRVEVSYIAQNLNWNADYTAVLEADEKMLDLTGWVTVDNRSGATYKNAKLKLLAGDVHRVQEVPRRMLADRMAGLGMLEMAKPQVEEKEFFEYHLYTVTRPATLKDRQTKQIEFTKAPHVPAVKRYFLESPTPWAYQREEKLKVDVKLEFKNRKEGGLGIPLPKGKVRVFKRDTDGSLEFVGEDRIDHTPKDETVRLQMGKAFDIVGERKQTDYEEDSRFFRESYHIAVRNHKKEAVRVFVLEHFFRWKEWKLYSEQPYRKVDAQTVEFAVDIPKDATGEIDYMVRYEKH